jgi:hypothetical protein
MLGNEFGSTWRLALAPDNEAGSADADPSADAGSDGGAASVGHAGETAQSAGASGPQRGQPAERTADAAPAKAGPSFPDTWRQDLAGGDKTFLKTLDRFDSPAALAKAYRELTTKLSAGELRAVKGPGDNATPEQVAAWRTSHGLPENAEAYVSGLKLADGMLAGEANRPLLASFAEAALAGNWSGEQYSQAVRWYFATQDRLLAERQRADGEFKHATSRDLMREWGNDYAVNRNTVAQFCDRHFAQDLKIDLLNARLPNGSALANHPGFNKAILEVARIVDPHGSQLPNASGAGLSNVESRIAEIEGKYMRAAHGSDQWKTYWTGESGARMQQEYRGLVAAREQTRSRGS